MDWSPHSFSGKFAFQQPEPALLKLPGEPPQAQQLDIWVKNFFLKCGTLKAKTKWGRRQGVTHKLKMRKGAARGPSTDA